MGSLLERRESPTLNVVTTLSVRLLKPDKTQTPSRLLKFLKNFLTPTYQEKPTPSNFCTPSSFLLLHLHHLFVLLYHSLLLKSPKRVMKYSNLLLNQESSKLNVPNLMLLNHKNSLMT